MLFNSFAFAIFLPIVFILYWSLPHRFRWILMLVTSYYFYMSWNAKYIILILFTTFVSYGAARLLENEKCKKKKKLILIGSVVFCLGILFFFKYFNFVSESITEFLNLFAIQMNPITLKLLLPVGISFYTFLTLGYLIDVYRGNIPAERHFGHYAAFISFFPYLLAGPIERASNLLPQIKAKHEFNYDQATYGLKLMAFGFIKKMIIADRLSLYVNTVYDVPQDFTGFSLVLASLLFTLQIYCDFSAYSDIAIGTAKLLGINLMTNFKSPYFSQSVKEFWSRWHISLSTWFRDYIYIPLGGNRVGKVRQTFNLMITFLASGLWHGANWTFIVWGGIHGAAQSIENLMLPRSKQKSTGIIGWIRVLIVFLFVSFAWIFFVSNSIGDAYYVICNMFTGITSPISYLHTGFSTIGIDMRTFLTIAITIFILAIYDWFSLKGDFIQWISSKKPFLRNLFYLLLILIILFLRVSAEAEFVYFKF